MEAKGMHSWVTSARRGMEEKEIEDAGSEY